MLLSAHNSYTNTVRDIQGRRRIEKEEKMRRTCFISVCDAYQRTHSTQHEEEGPSLWVLSRLWCPLVMLDDNHHSLWCFVSSQSKGTQKPSVSCFNTVLGRDTVLWGEKSLDLELIFVYCDVQYFLLGCWLKKNCRLLCRLWCATQILIFVSPSNVTIGEVCWSVTAQWVLSAQTAFW